MLILQNISYTHPNKDLLFSDINLTVNNHEKTALIGNNGAGKSTLLKIIAKELQPSNGQISVETEPFFVPQIFGQFNHLTIAEALKIDKKLNALKEILNGNTSEENFNLLNDDWTIEDRCNDALQDWQLTDLDLSQKMETLSGGQKTKVFLAGISIHQPELILLDEPNNHLDIASRQLLYDFIQTTKSTLVVVSHDRKLLNLLDTVCELSKHGIKVYGGNYDFYKEQKQKLDNRGKGKQEKASVARIMMNTLRNNAENSTSKLKSVHVEKIIGILQNLQELRSLLPDVDKMK